LNRIAPSRLLSWIALLGLILLVWPQPAAAWWRAASKPGFPVNLGGLPVEESSVCLGDVDGDGRLEIFCADTGGTIFCYDHLGRQKWALPTGRIIKSSPSFGDVTGDGQPNLVIGLGADTENRVAGGILCLDAATGVSRWEREPRDIYGGQEGTFSNGVPDGVFSSPNLTDINGDGRLDVAIASWDHQIYLINGWAGSNYNRYWPYDFWDSSWGTPVVADIDQDTIKEVIIGADLTESWVTGSFNGGRMWVFDLYAEPKPGWPVRTSQTFYSSPAVGDINGDGRLDIVCGTGIYYEGQGMMVHAWDADGADLPGWPVDVGGYIFSSPALADINEDGLLEVIVGCFDGRVYCLGHDGSILWETMLVSVSGESDGTVDDRFRVRSSPVVADINGNGHLEVLITFAWEMVVLDWQGNQLTGEGRQSYVGDHSQFSSPGVADVDGDGFLEIVLAGGAGAGSGGLYCWSTSAPAGSAVPWATFHKDFQRTGLVTD